MLLVSRPGGRIIAELIHIGNTLKEIMDIIRQREAR
jgi:hypothetical protein